MPPVTTPHVVCVSCGRQCGIWSPLCTDCSRALGVLDDELPPCIGAKFAETTDHIFRTAEEGDHQ